MEVSKNSFIMGEEKNCYKNVGDGFRGGWFKLGGWHVLLIMCCPSTDTKVELYLLAVLKLPILANSNIPRK